jgi:hypothetical protein
MKRGLAVVTLGLVVAAYAGCDGVSNKGAFGEPFRVRGAQFVRGALPGTAPLAPPPPVDAGTEADAGAPAAAGPLTVTGIVTLNPNVYPGEGGKQISGRATKDASSVALRFDDIGTGYWVLPLGAADPLYPGENTWSAACDFDPNAPAGPHPLRVVAIDANGNAGAQSEQSFCLQGKVPDNLHACHPQIASPEAVFTLTWDQDVDLDLHVVSPAGRDIDPKHPLADPVDAGARPSPAAAIVDHDSLASCTPDGRRQEDLVFQARPSGTWEIYVNMFDACKKPAVTFTVQTYEAQGDGQDRHLVLTYTKSGRLVATDANGGARPGLFVLEYPFD